MHVDVDIGSHHCDAVACRRLWIAVVDQAVADMQSSTQDRGRRYDSAMSAVWFFFSGESDDRIEHAGFDPAWARMQVLRQAIAGEGKWLSARRFVYDYLKRGHPMPADVDYSRRDFIGLMNALDRGGEDGIQDRAGAAGHAGDH